MINSEAIKYINQVILKQASKVSYSIADIAPDTEKSLFNVSSLVVWSGASDNTIFQDASVNWAFRALHDALHLKTGLGFSHAEEIELGRIQASQFDSTLLQDLVYCEISLQAKYHLETGLFVQDQVEFTVNKIKVLQK